VQPPPAMVTTTVDERPAFAVISLLACAVGTLALAIPGGTARLVLVLAFLLVGPGSVVVSMPRINDRVVSWALAICAGMSIACGVGVLTLWTHIWQPTPSIAGLIGAVAATAGMRLVKFIDNTPLRPRRLLSSLIGHAPQPKPVDQRATRTWRERIGSAAPPAAILAAVGLWIVALSRIRPASIDSYGLSVALGLPFLAAVLLLGLGFSGELFGRARVAVLAAGVLAATVIMHASVPILDGTLEYAWTYKHIGVVDLIRDNGHLLNSNDIYQQWPGFFATVALFSQLSGIDALSFAAWSSLTFALINALLVVALLRQFTKDRRVIATGVLLFQAGMWVDIGYFSPQAFVFPLMLGFWLILVRWLLMVPTGRTDPDAGRLYRMRAALVRNLTVAPVPDQSTRWWAAAGATGLFAAITVSHQLTPFVVMVPTATLAVLGILRPRRLLLILAVVLTAFTVPRLWSVAQQYSIFDFDLLSNAAGNAGTWRTPQQEFSAVVARILAIGLWGAALFVMWRARRKLGTVVVPAVLGFTPFVTLAGGNYGGEAIYRVFAFSSPFVVLLIAMMWAARRRGGVRAIGLSAVGVAVILLAGLQGLQGQLVVHQVRSGDIVAAEYFYAHAVPGSSLVLAAPNFPTKLAANYNEFNEPRTAVDISLVGEPEFAGTLNGQRLSDVERYVRDLNTPTSYLVVSTAMSSYTDYFGSLPKGSMDSLRSALDASPDWRVFYQTPQLGIYQLLPAG
jgi:hypothetical protein